MNTVSAPLYSPFESWRGRDDGPGPDHARWHSVIRREAAAGGVALIGFSSDEGVQRNGGRAGAAEGPAALRHALADLAIHDEALRFDVGTVTTQGEDLESAQRELSERVRDLAATGNLVVVLGGGHETSFATHRGVREARGEMSIINLDAHFDLRDAPYPTSGTPFAQIAQLCGDQFNYSVLGVSEPNNTATLFHTAARLGVRTVLDTELAQLSPAECARVALDCVAGQRPIHLSIDLDVLPASTAPGVSAPAGFGVALEKIRAIATAVAGTGRLALVDVVELNPRYDIDARTARTAARLIHDIVAAHVRCRSGR
ncbi:formimidoylglutamase [uncultured Corynebacterium sp.]|uniref:formimidoylglutamase n=1 Tax=uncultured Corynebacterium sp. TaxID=159447 RepID=UPI002596F514|nr:formimidoylglutamase [uncultured Corynebacterium sp.]